MHGLAILYAGNGVGYVAVGLEVKVLPDFPGLASDFTKPSARRLSAQKNRPLHA
jgi:hypothetical protein